MKGLSRSELSGLADIFASPAPRRSSTQSVAQGEVRPLAELRSILACLSADEGRGNGSIDLAGTNNWLGTIWAVIRTYGEPAKEMLREWSMRSQRYDEEGFDTAWAAHDPNHPNPVTKWSLHALAREHGWTGYAPEPSAGRYKLLNGVAIKALLPMQWCIKGLLPRQGLAAIYGPSASGKSFLAIEIAMAIAYGGFWNGRRVRSRPVVFVTLEGEAGLQNRLTAWQLRTGKALPENFFAIVQPFNLLEQQDVLDLIAVLPKSCAVFIDTLNRAAPGADENSSVDMGKMIAAMKQIVEGAEALVVPVHHTGKDQAKGLRGHSSLFAALDGAIEVERIGQVRTFRAAKVKDGNDGDKTGFRLDIVPLGFDEDGDPITSCVVVMDDGPFVERKQPQGPKQRAVLAAIKAGAPMPLEDAIAIAGPIVTGARNRERPDGKRTIDALIQGDFLRLSGLDGQEVSAP